MSTEKPKVFLSLYTEETLFKKRNSFIKEIRKKGRGRETQVERSQLSIIHANGERKERERSNRLKKFAYYPKIILANTSKFLHQLFFRPTNKQ